MFIPYRVIQIKGKPSKQAHCSDKSRFKFLNPSSCSFFDTIEMPDGEKKLNPPQKCPIQTISKRPQTVSVRREANKSTSFSKTITEDKKQKKMHRTGVSLSPKPRTSDEKNEKKKISSKRKESSSLKVQAYRLFNFCACVEKSGKNGKNSFERKGKKMDRDSDGQRVANPEDYGHRSLNIDSIKQKNKIERAGRPQSSQKLRHTETSRRTMDSQRFQDYLSERKRTFQLNERCKSIKLQTKEDPLIIKGEAECAECEPVISKPNMVIMEGMYDKWKNSYRLHVTGKTVRKWNKKQTSRLDQYQFCFSWDKDKEEPKKRAGKRRKIVLDDENRIEAWKESQKQKLEEECYLDYDPEFTLGQEDIDNR